MPFTVLSQASLVNARQCSVASHYSFFQRLLRTTSFVFFGTKIAHAALVRFCSYHQPLNRFNTMKTLLACCLTSMLLLANRNTTCAGDQDFVLVNKTGVEIHALHVSPSDKEEWGDDILGKDTLGDGESAEIKFSPKEEAEKWDLRVADKQGNAIEWSDLNLLKISKVTLHYSDGKATADVE
jgi:hypothetical protein